MKKLLIISLFLLPFIFFNCKKDNNKSETLNIPLDEAKNIIVKTDKILKNDIESFTEEINKDSLYPIEITDNVDSNYDIIITLDKNNIPKDWSQSELFSKNFDVSPENAKSLFNGVNNLIIYSGYSQAEKDIQIIINYYRKKFSETNLKTSNIIYTGDMMLSRWVALRISQNGINYPFANVSDYLKQADITIGNLESPTSETGPYQTQAGTMSFKYDPKITPELKNAGFDIFNLANNHFGNAGTAGIEYTLKNLADNGLGYFGAGENNQKAREPKIVEVNNIKYAFLGYSDSSITPASYQATGNRAGLNLDNISAMQEDVKNAKSAADVVIVSMHLGTEYQNKPNQKQINFAHSAIDAGADFIYGHHPHVIQSIEIYNGKPIFYSLGNFIFDQTQPNTKEGLVVKTSYIYNQIVSIELKTVKIANYAQPNWQSDKALETIINRINNE